MKLFSVVFDDSNEVGIESGLELTDLEGSWCVELGTDVGGATLAMVPFRIMLDDGFALDAAVEGGDPQRVHDADVVIDDVGSISLRPESVTGDRALVVLSVIQRSPDARTEIEPYTDGVECVGNAFDRPMDTQVLLMSPASRTRFRRFQRGGNYGPWEVIEWDGTELKASRAADESQ